MQNKAKRLIRSLLVAFALFGVGGSALAAACTGIVIEEGCNNCGFLWLQKRPFMKETVYYTDQYGVCQTSTITITGDCGDC